MVISQSWSKPREKDSTKAMNTKNTPVIKMGMGMPSTLP
mgnify:CR=1 FL=1